MKGGLGWQVGRRRVADTNAVSGAEEVGRAGGAECAGGTRDKAGGARVCLNQDLKKCVDTEQMYSII